MTPTVSLINSPTTAANGQEIHTFAHTLSFKRDGERHVRLGQTAQKLEKHTFWSLLYSVKNVLPYLIRAIIAPMHKSSMKTKMCSLMQPGSLNASSRKSFFSPTDRLTWWPRAEVLLFTFLALLHIQIAGGHFD